MRALAQYAIAAEPPSSPAEPIAPAPTRGASALAPNTSLAVAEVASLPAFALGGLPVPFAIETSHSGGAAVWFAFCQRRYAEARARGAYVFARAEWEALIVGSEADRATAQQFAKYLTTKGKQPSKLLEAHHTLGGVDPARRRPKWDVCRVLASWGLSLVSVQIDPTEQHPTELQNPYCGHVQEPK
jgi:hypothetical protein